jgi:hypothetical protein
MKKSIYIETTVFSFDHIRIINRRLGLVTPEIVTPEQLFEEK